MPKGACVTDCYEYVYLNDAAYTRSITEESNASKPAATGLMLPAPPRCNLC